MSAIVRTTVDGRPATVVYLDEKFRPTTPELAWSLKVLFDDGEVVFLKAARQEESHQVEVS